MYISILVLDFLVNLTQKNLCMTTFIRHLTWVKISDHGSSIEVASSSLVLELLIVVVEGIGGMVLDSVR